MNDLKNLRKKRGYSINTLHKLTGIPVRTLEDWDNNKRQIQYYHRLKLLAGVLKCTIEELMTKEEKCLYGGEKAVIFLEQEEEGVRITIFRDTTIAALYDSFFGTIIPREKALELLEYMKTHEDIKAFIENEIQK